MRQTQLPALDRAERGQAVHDFLEVVPALQNPQALGYFLKAGGTISCTVPINRSSVSSASRVGQP